ncbi:MAG TPA: HEAT repeat domain-containing protein, partial [Blastocatellia bacterium]|nr:HEAT repeat domain-containing protein [Blastocatellia bacterium]
LGGIKSSKAVSELSEKVRDEAPDVRSAVATALGDLRDKRAVDPLIQLLKDEYKMVKISAALALADIGDKRALGPLNEAVSSEKEEETRTQLKEALQRLRAVPDQT